MEPFVIELKPYNDDTTVYLTNSEAIVKETAKDIWVPYPSSNGDACPLWIYTKEDGDSDDYMEAFNKLNKDGLYKKTKYGIHTHNIKSISFLKKNV